MGDYNDNPNDESVSLLTQKSNYRPQYEPLFNPMRKLFQKGLGVWPIGIVGIYLIKSYFHKIGNLKRV
jgi:hypothetical protein